MKYAFSDYNIVSEKNGVAYVANTLSGALIRLDEPSYQAVQSQNLAQLSEKDRDFLADNGVLVEDTMDEKRMLRAAYTAFSRGRTSVTVIVCPTLECNFACPYCFESRQTGVMSGETQAHVLDYVKDILSRGYKELELSWFGGEPLLYPDIIAEMSPKIKALCEEKQVQCRFVITTNGYCINEKVMDMFRALSFKEVRITLDGGREVHDTRRMLRSGRGTFDVIVANVKKLSAQGIPVKVRVNMDKQNPNALEDVKKELGGLENVYIYPATVSEEPTQDDCQREKCFTGDDEVGAFHQALYEKYDFKPTFESLFNKGVSCCMAEHDDSCVIDHKGYVYKCVNDVGHPAWAVCNVNGDYTAKNPRVVAKYLGRDPFNEEPCRECKFLPLCYGGCVNAYARCGVHTCAQVKYLFDSIVATTLGV